MRQIIAILVEDKFGALSRIIELFSSRGYNLDSICSGVCEEPNLQRLTLVIEESPEKTDRIVTMLNNVVDVIEAHRVDEKTGVSREMMLAKVQCNGTELNSIKEFLAGKMGHIIDQTNTSLTFEITGTARDLDLALAEIRQYKILELARTGEAAIHR